MAKYVHGNLAVQEPIQTENERQSTRTRAKSRWQFLKSERFLYMLMIAVFVIVAMLVISRYAAVYELNLRSAELEQEIKTLQNENNELKLKMSQLSDLQSILKDAKTIGLQQIEVKEIDKIGYQPPTPTSSNLVSNQ